MKLKKHDFIELEYTGKLDDGTIFDTTNKDDAQKSGLNPKAKYGPVTICLGENHILPGIEEQIIGGEPKSFDVTLEPDKAFGRKDAKLLKLVPMKAFKSQEVQPFPGLEVNMDNNYGTIRSVSGGRVIVDFNHPLASRTLHYSVKVNKQVTDVLEKAKALFKNEMQLADIPLEIKEKTLVIDEDKFPKEVLDALKKRVTELVPEITDVVLKKDFKESNKTTDQK
jgi:FKBP-type peptidyl-prolyl cis-trans isomerase 2